MHILKYEVLWRNNTVKHFAAVLLIIGLVFFHTLIGEAQSVNDYYQVGIDDVIDIRVLDQPSLMTLSSVTVDGTITFPYLGNVYVKGMTLAEIKEEGIVTKVAVGAASGAPGTVRGDDSL